MAADIEMFRKIAVECIHVVNNNLHPPLSEDSPYNMVVWTVTSF